MPKKRLPVLNGPLRPACYGKSWSHKDKLCRGSRKRTPCDYYVSCRRVLMNSSGR
jgi:hypothetical protein